MTVPAASEHYYSHFLFTVLYKMSPTFPFILHLEA